MCFVCLLSDITSNISRNDALYCQEHIQSGNILLFSNDLLFCYIREEGFHKAGYNYIKEYV